MCHASGASPSCDRAQPMCAQKKTPSILCLLRGIREGPAGPARGLREIRTAVIDGFHFRLFKASSAAAFRPYPQDSRQDWGLPSTPGMSWLKRRPTSSLKHSGLRARSEHELSSTHTSPRGGAWAGVARGHPGAALPEEEGERLPWRRPNTHIVTVAGRPTESQGGT